LFVSLYIENVVPNVDACRCL